MDHQTFGFFCGRLEQAKQKRKQNKPGAHVAKVLCYQCCVSQYPGETKEGCNETNPEPNEGELDHVLNVRPFIRSAS